MGRCLALVVSGAALIVLGLAGYLLLPRQSASTDDPVAISAATEAMIGTPLVTPALTGAVRLVTGGERPQLRIAMILTDADYAALAAALAPARPHAPRRTIHGLPGPSRERFQTESPWRASYFTVERSSAERLWLYARPLEQDLTEVHILAYDPDPAPFAQVPALAGIARALAAF